MRKSGEWSKSASALIVSDSDKSIERQVLGLWHSCSASLSPSNFVVINLSKKLCLNTVITEQALKDYASDQPQ